MINFPKIISFGATPESSNKNKKINPSALERSPMTDTFVGKTEETQKIKKTLSTKNKKDIAEINKETAEKLDFVTKEKILTKELLHFLQPKLDAKGNKIFTPSQRNVIDLANEKLKFFDTISTELANDAKNNGKEVLNYFKDVFGGEEDLGKHLVIRTKDKVSIYNKLVKEFRNERIKSEVHNVFSKKLYNSRYSQLDKTEQDLVALCIEDEEVKLDSKDFKIIENAFKSDPKDYVAKKMYGKVYDNLTKQEKNKVKEFVFKESDQFRLNATTKQARHEAISYVKDLIGLRLILPTGNRDEMNKVEYYLEKAIQEGTINMTRMSNYHANHILPYISQDKARYWKELTGMELIENSEVRKRNGYTTTQINLKHMLANKKRPIRIELQIRTEELNKIGNDEHLIYDIIEKKNISKDIEELQLFYESTGIIKAVNEVFNSKDKEQKYTDYERAYYSYVRNKELKSSHVEIKKPLLAEFGLGEYEYILSFDALKNINKKANEIKEAFEKKEK